MFRLEPVKKFIEVGYFLLVLGFISWALFNVLAPAFFIDGFFTNPSFFAGLVIIKYYIFIIAFIIFVMGMFLYAFAERGYLFQLEKFITKKKILLEVVLNKEDADQALTSMESLFENLFLGGGEGDWYQRWWLGNTRPVFSFEVVSRGGIVHFYIHTPKNLKDSVISHVYTFYPKVQISEVEDYVSSIDYASKEYSLFGFEWKYNKKDSLPIKTYVEFGLEKQTAFDRDKASPIDPLAPLYDLCGSLNGEEQIWIQYIFRTQKYARIPVEAQTNPFDKKFWSKKKFGEEIKDQINELAKELGKEAKDKSLQINFLEKISMKNKRLIETGSRIAEKSVFEVGVRILYITPEDKFNPVRIGDMTNLFRLTNTENSYLSPTGTALESKIIIPALEKRRKAGDKERIDLLQLYRDRMFWYNPAMYRYSTKSEKNRTKFRNTMVMSSETLATICHFPTSFVRTPSVRRAVITGSEPPEGLPT